MYEMSQEKTDFFPSGSARQICLTELPSLSHLQIVDEEIIRYTHTFFVVAMLPSFTVIFI